MLVSGAELEVTIKKAATAAGAPPGIDAEFGKAALMLSTAGFDPTPAFATALENCINGRAVGFAAEAAERGQFVAEGANGTDLSALFAGSSICDLLAVTKGRIVAASVDVPIVVVSMISARGLSAVISLCSDDSIRIFCRDGVIDPPARVLERFHRSADIECAVIEPGPAGAQGRSRLAGHSDVDDDAWRRIVDIAEKCLVTNSEESRLRDAGAGLIDED